jgi:hypothetical protein
LALGKFEFRFVLENGPGVLSISQNDNAAILGGLWADSGCPTLKIHQICYPASQGKCLDFGYASIGLVETSE